MPDLLCVHKCNHIGRNYEQDISNGYWNRYKIHVSLNIEISFCFVSVLPAAIAGATASVGHQELRSDFSCFVNFGSYTALGSVLPQLMTNSVATVMVEASGMDSVTHLPQKSKYQLFAAMYYFRRDAFVAENSYSDYILDSAKLVY